MLKSNVVIVHLMVMTLNCPMKGPVPPMPHSDGLNGSAYSRLGKHIG